MQSNMKMADAMATTAKVLLQSTQWPHSENFPETFSKDLHVTSDDLGIPKKFPFRNSWQLCFRFQRSSSFLISVN